MSAERRAIPVEVAQHVLWWAGDTNLGLDGGGFVQALLVTISRADLGNRALLATGFPEYVAAMAAFKDEPWGLDWLRSVVKAELDGVDLGLDFAQVRS